jgi:hypothetical protein
MMGVGWLVTWFLLVQGSFAGVRIMDFEKGVPTAAPKQLGFRTQDQALITSVRPGANGTKGGGRVLLDAGRDSVFLQGDVRRLYLINSKPDYKPGLANALTFWIKVPKGSPLVRESGPNALGFWTYHWRPEDVKVGGASNKSLMTDSMMHGYANFYFVPGCEERWVKVVLSASAFQQQRNYFHWYAARGVTGDQDFFSTLRQLQLKYLPPSEVTADFGLDELAFETLAPTADVSPQFRALSARASRGDVSVPIVLKNTTDKRRRYRFFLSSEVGAPREKIYQAMWMHDDLTPGRTVQGAVGGDGGLGAAVLADEAGAEVGFRELALEAGGTWRGAVVHRLQPEMLGRWTGVALPKGEFLVRRDTLTTSAVFWDPDEPAPGGMAYVRAAPSNADDGNHAAPPGFPKQERPPPGWRSEDIPLGQVGGSFVSEIMLE